MVPWKLPAELALWVTRLDALLHRRLAGRLATVLVGMLFAQGRRTVASWLRAADVGQAFPAYYYFLGSLGRKVDLVASALLHLAVQIIAPGNCLLLGLDDTPTKHYGPKVQGAGIHHNPTPGPATASSVAHEVSRCCPKQISGYKWSQTSKVTNQPNVLR